jgi:hypothetical protein
MSLFSSVVPVLYAAGRRFPSSSIAHAAQYRFTLLIVLPSRMSLMM